MSNKFALIIGNTEYSDPSLAQLTAPGKDAEDFARVLKDTEIGAFDDVVTLLNQPEYVVREAIDDFFNQKMPDDLLVLYFSGHGVRDEIGALYLAVKNTIRSKLRATGIKSDYIREAMDQSRSRRQVLVLDCCNSGAFAQGTKAETGGSVGTKSAFEGGYGRVILTASDATQFAWEGDKVIGETDNSLFTHYLVEGLEGKADRDGDGHITVDELYEYAYEKVRLATPKQTPSKFSTKEQGKMILRQNIRIEDIKPIPLPDDLIAATKSSLPFVREGAVRQLEDLLKGKNLGLARSAREALERIAEEDDSRTISRAAFQALEAVKQADAEHLAKLEAERIAEDEKQAQEQAEAQQKAEAERIAQAKLELERKTKEEAEKLTVQKAEKERLANLEVARLAEEKRLAVEAEKERIAKADAELLAAQKTNEDRIVRAKLDGKQITEGKIVADSVLTNEVVKEEDSIPSKPNPNWGHAWQITLGWALCFGILYNIAELGPGALFGGFISGGIVGLTLRQGKIISKISGVLILAVGMAISNLAFTVINAFLEVDARFYASLAIWGVVDGLIMVFVLRQGQVPLSGKSTMGILLGWASAYLVGFAIRGFFNFGLYGVIDGGIAGAIGGFIMIWQIREELKNR